MDAAFLLKATSHEHRLMILCILLNGEQTVGELETFLGLQQAIVSQQLARLRMDNLVESRRSGRKIYYSIADGKAREMILFLYRLYCSDDEYDNSECSHVAD
ncbi:ArsR/SmtB family transcription factor [Allorhizobium sonneratiae]|uniref:ArsR/SmtB family transcription factor n=1 Tax=Allorhizobium sonneratiae TaxID=2934936 RepID=UPI002033D16B|nr:metalloregulator ArsR/SmtB family transcription factor [Allorhizobium sonneratiae]